MRPDADRRAFYVLPDTCMRCGAPESEAPSLMSDDGVGCYFRRQPASDEELVHAMQATWVSCCDALRYGGQDESVRRRMAEAGIAQHCDHPLPVAPLVRDRAHVEARSAISTVEVRAILVYRLADYHLQLATASDGEQVVSFSWSRAAPPTVAVRPIKDGFEVVVRGGNQNDSVLVDEALRADDRLRVVEWFPSADRSRALPTPI